MKEESMKPIIVCLTGSTRFVDTYHEVNRQKTLDGEIVLSVGVFRYSEWLSPYQVHKLGKLQDQKMDLADYLLVLNVNGYIGDHTRNDIEYAKAQGKRVEYLEPIE